MKIIVIGPQGSGKSTQAKMLAEKLSLPYVEMGHLLREKSADTDTQAGKIRQALEVGNLVPDQITIQTLHQRLEKSDCKNGFVLDGYPRNYVQLEGLPPGINKVFYIHVPDDVAIKRLIARGRHDDSLNIITRRLELFHRETEPLLAYFRQEKITEEVDGGRNVEEIHQDVMSRLKKKQSISTNEKNKK